MIFDGFAEIPALEEKIAREICAENGGYYLGEDPARKWWNERFRHYYDGQPIIGDLMTDPGKQVATEDGVFIIMKGALVKIKSRKR